MRTRTTRIPPDLLRAVAALALLGTVAGCGDNAGTTAPRQDAQVRIRGDHVVTPSGAVFTTAEWAAQRDKGPWLVPAATIAARIEERQRGLRARAGQVLLSVTGGAAPHVLCHSSAPYICDILPALVPGSTAATWDDATWAAATEAEFAEFDVIYISDDAGSYAGLTASKNTWGKATTGRVALTGVHFEHCTEGYGTHEEACQVLKASLEWIHAGAGTGLLMSTQVVAGAMPSVAPYAGVTYLSHGNGYDLVRITDGSHPTMAGSSDASLSNFNQSSHSLFGTTGSFASVAEVCDIPVFEQPSVDCSTATRTGTWRPHFLVSSSGSDDARIVIGADGSGTITTPSGHAALRFPAGSLDPGTVVTLEKIERTEGPGPLDTDQQQVGPFYQIEVSPAQPMGPGIDWALCVEVSTNFDRLRIAKQRFEGEGVVIFPRVDPGGLVTCTHASSTGESVRPGQRGPGGSALRFASRLMGDALSVFTPKPLYAIHLGIGGKSDGSTTDSGYSPWGAVVVSYDVQGFSSPVTNPGFTTPFAVNRVRAGRAVPLKFSLGGDFGLDIFAADSPISAGYKCYQSEVETVLETVTANTSGLQYDAASGQYTYVWKTNSTWAGTCRKLTMTFTDGQKLSAFFEFTK